MKLALNQRGPGRLAFTLIELLVVIAIIGVLAALLLPAGAVIKRKATLKRAETELVQVETAIERYKTDKGFYPPDNGMNSGNPQLYSVANSPAMRNSLFYELSGVKQAGTGLETLDGAHGISPSDISAAFGVGGVMNLSSGGDEGTVARSFIKDFKPSQYLAVPANQMDSGLSANLVTVMGTTLRGPVAWSNADGDDINPWRYVSSVPANNTEKVDIWVDVLVGGKTNRVSNWSEKPEVVSD